MADGWNGITVETDESLFLPPAFGYQGITLEEESSQYFAPMFGFVGILIEDDEPLPIYKKTVKMVAKNIAI